MAKISINLHPTIDDRGDSIGAMVDVEYVSQIAKGCAEVIRKVACQGIYFEVITVAFRKYSDASPTLQVVCRVIFNTVGGKIERDALFEVNSPSNLAEEITKKVGWEIGYALRELQRKLERDAKVLPEVASFAFEAPYLP